MMGLKHSEYETNGKKTLGKRNACEKHECPLAGWRPSQRPAKWPGQSDPVLNVTGQLQTLFREWTATLDQQHQVTDVLTSEMHGMEFV
jgi:hypothetical protein